MSWRKQSMWAGVFLAVSAAAWGAEEKTDAAKKGDAATAPQAAEATAADIAAWIKQLDADKFADRQEASEKLYAAGKAAIPASAEAAAGPSLEVTVRSIDLLQRFLDSPDKAIKDAATAGLEKIAKSDKPNAARRTSRCCTRTKTSSSPNPVAR